MLMIFLMMLLLLIADNDDDKHDQSKIAIYKIIMFPCRVFLIN